MIFKQQLWFIKSADFQFFGSILPCCNVVDWSDTYLKFSFFKCLSFKHSQNQGLDNKGGKSLVLLPVLVFENVQQSAKQNLFAPLPVRISKIRRATAIEADFQRVPFSTFISADNYYQGFLHTKNEALLKDLATLLYPKVKSRHQTTPLLLNAFYWFSSLKHYFARLFPHFLQPMSADEQNLLGYAPPIGEVLRTAMNAQIRALTGGDITKEEAVLSMDTWRALTELDAKAKEVEDIKRQTK